MTCKILKLNHRTRIYSISKTLKVFDNQDVDAHSCMVRNFRFDATKPGLVFIKEFPSTEEKND